MLIYLRILVIIMAEQPINSAYQLNIQDLISYLTSLPKVLLSQLWESPPCCLIVFRELSDMGRYFLLRILYILQPLPMSLIISWVSSEKEELAKNTIQFMNNLNICSTVPLLGSMGEGILLCEDFRVNFQLALSGESLQLPSAKFLGEDKHAKTPLELQCYAEERWQSILNYIVDPDKSQNGVNTDLVEILIQSNLMKQLKGKSLPKITTFGFQFLLMNQPSQVWFFILQYLKTCEQRDMNLVECIIYLFQLTFSSIGKDYSVEKLTDTQLMFLQHLREFGLVYKRKQSSRRFYSTRMAIDLLIANKPGTLQSRSAGYILMETNFRLTAYTNSTLSMEIISFFSQILYKFPNVIVAIITRDSLFKALTDSITADQIITFLKAHAHQEIHKNSCLIPPTVENQIRLWESERNRLTSNDGVMYDHFNNSQEYEIIKSYAEIIGVLMWFNATKRILVVSKEGHEDVKRYWKKHKPHS